MDDIKEKLINAVADGALDAAEVVGKLLMYIDEDTVRDIIERERWEEECGIGMSESEEEY